MERVIVARTSTLPKRLQPMLATFTDGPFDDNDWIFEEALSKESPTLPTEHFLPAPTYPPRSQLRHCVQ
jgi:hypothetical protein